MITNFHRYRGTIWLQSQSYQFEDWDRGPCSKNRNGVLNELVVNLIVLYVSNCIRILIFRGIEVLIGCKVSLISLRTGNEPPVLKIAFRGILQLGSVSHRFLRLKLHMSGMFHAGIKFCTIDV